jgi:hypothetical protein
MYIIIARGFAGRMGCEDGDREEDSLRSSCPSPFSRSSLEIAASICHVPPNHPGGARNGECDGGSRQSVEQTRGMVKA